MDAQLVQLHTETSVLRGFCGNTEYTSIRRNNVQGRTFYHQKKVTHKKTTDTKKKNTNLYVRAGNSGKLGRFFSLSGVYTLSVCNRNLNTQNHCWRCCVCVTSKTLSSWSWCDETMWEFHRTVSTHCGNTLTVGAEQTECRRAHRCAVLL